MSYLSIGFWTTLALIAADLVTLVRAVTRPNRAPASRIAWVLVIVGAPIIGILAYLLLGDTSIGIKRIRRLAAAEAHTPLPDDAAFPPQTLGETEATLFALGTSINGFAPTDGNRIALAADSNAAIDMLVADIAAARDHVHICFYIWLDDRNGGKVADALSAAAARGVACRVMVDAIGSRAFVRSERWGQMRRAGVDLAVALRPDPSFSHPLGGRLDLRNHRKIVVIDNAIGYCGSQNCSDPEFRVKPRYAPWVDVFFRIEGPVVRQQQHLFVTNWMSERNEDLSALPIALPLPVAHADGVAAQVFGTGPTTRAHAMADMFTYAITGAKRELCITTPYFAPDQAILLALESVARRGVSTTIIFPKNNDSKLVAATSRSYYADLLDAGVAVWEYPLGLLHAKTLSVDGRYALVGSANMDRRSLDLNYENNMVVAGPAFAATVRARQQSYLDQSQRVVREEVARWSLARRFYQNAVAMVAPIL